MAKKTTKKITSKGKATLVGGLKGGTVTGNVGTTSKLLTPKVTTPAVQQAATAATNNTATTTNPNFIKAQTDLPEMKYREGWNPYNLTEIKPYQESQVVQDARTRLNAYLDGEGKPTYSSQYADTIKNLADKIANREDFSYDFNTDPLYQNYRDQYQRQAVLGQQGAMANAAALTGGYGSSYASTAGNLAYQENMSQLNNVIPQLYQMAYDKYNTDLSNRRADLSMYQDLENTDYGRYRDSMSDWNTDRGYYTDYYNNEYNKDYGQYRDNVADVQHNDQMRYQSYVDGRNYTSGEHWNKKNYDQSVKEWKESIRQYNESLKENKRQFNEQLKKVKTSGGSGGGYRGRSGSGSSYVSVPNGVKQAIRKWQNGNEGQQKVAWNSLNGTLKSKYGLTSAQIDYLYNDYLGFGKKSNNAKVTAAESKASDNARVSDASKKKYQSIDDVPKKYRDGILGYADFVRNMPSSPSLSKYGSYPDYLEAMVKKNKKKAK